MRLAQHLTVGALRAFAASKRLLGPSRHCGDARVYGHATTAMHDIEYTPPSLPSNGEVFRRNGWRLSSVHGRTCLPTQTSFQFLGTQGGRCVFIFSSGYATHAQNFPGKKEKARSEISNFEPVSSTTSNVKCVSYRATYVLWGITFRSVIKAQRKPF